MVTDSLPVIPHIERIEADAKAVADGIRKSLTPIERDPIVAYGRCLLEGKEPSGSQTFCFVYALRRYAPYIRAAGRLSTDLVALRSFQDAIARQVAGEVQS